MGYKENLKSNLEHLMKHCNVTNEMLAEHTGISRSSINRIRMGKGNPTVETLQAICNFFNVSILEITESFPIKLNPLNSASPIVETTDTNLKNIPLVTWDSLDSLWENEPTENLDHISSNKEKNAKLYSVITPQEYINIPKESLLIFDKNRNPRDGDYIIVIEKNSEAICLVEYIRDIMTEYVRSCFVLSANQRDSQLFPFSNFKLLGVILEARKIFIPI